MRLFETPQKRLKALTVFYIFGVVMMGLEITQNIAHYESAAQKTIWQWFVLLEATALLLLLAIMTVYSRVSVQQKVTELISETMETLVSGILHFDDRGKLTRYNPAAVFLLPELKKEEHKSNFSTYKNFLAFIYDHSLDIQDRSQLYSDSDVSESQSRLLFREVIKLQKDRIALVQFYQRSTSDIVAILTDISLMKRHIDEMAMLSDENKIMIKAIESAGYGLIVAQSIDRSAPVIYANKNFAQMLKVGMDNILDKSFYEVFENTFEDQLEVVKDAIRTARQEGKAQNIWLKMRHDHNAILWYCFNILFFVDAFDKEFFVAFASEQTQSRLSQARIYQSQKLEAVSQLAGGVAHDFNNILSVIDGYTKLLKKGLDRGEDITQFLDQIHRSVKRGSEITGRLLIFGQQKVEQKIRLDVCEYIRDFEALLIPIVHSPVKLIMSIQEDACYIDTTMDSIAQILMSLVSNACDAMPNGGDLIISVSEATRVQLLLSQKAITPGQSYVSIQIIDSGTGIDPDVLGRVYEPFYTTKDPGKNSGLGLSLVYGLVKEIEGKVDIRSTPGMGTAVTILIPMQEHPLHLAFQGNAQISEKDSSLKLKNKKILIVEDMLDVLEMESQLLREAGMEVIKASSAIDALEVCENYDGKIDFALFDVTLPGMSGIELSDLFSALRPETKIILISAYPVQPGEGQRTASNHGRVILAKPLAYEKLEEILIHSIEGARTQKSEGNYWAENTSIQ